ncbi:hypothetical protein EV361DRAFT_956721 [Lentinula raphanica]|nr:hypothetical protein EV361DRAFT_956721 [Lentinula raphanica]
MSIPSLNIFQSTKLALQQRSLEIEVLKGQTSDTIDASKTELNELRTQLARAQEQLQEAQTEGTGSFEELRRKVAELEELSLSHANLKVELAGMKEKEISANQTYEEMNTQLSSLRAERDQIKKKLHDEQYNNMTLQAEKADVLDDLEDMWTIKLEKAEQEHTAQVLELQSQLSNAAVVQAAAEDQQKGLVKELEDRHRMEIDMLQKQIAIQQNAIGDDSREANLIRAYENELQNIRQQLAEANLAVDLLKKEIAIERETREGLNGVIVNERQVAQNLSVELSGIKASLQNLETEKTQWESKKQELTQELMSARAEMKSFETETATNTRERDDAAKLQADKMQELTAQVAEKTTLLQTLQTEKDQWKIKAQGVTQELMSAKAEIELLKVWEPVSGIQYLTYGIFRRELQR